MASLNPSAMDGLEGLPDPNAISQQQDQDYERGMGGTSAQQIFQMGRAASRGLFGNPRVDQAQDLQTAVANATQDSDAHAPDNEDGIAASMRRLKATYAAVADKSPQAAAQISNKIALLTEAQNQQAKLNAVTDLDISRAKKENDSLALDLAEKGHIIVGNEKTGKKYGEVSQFDGQGNLVPDWQQQRDKLVASSGDPDAQAQPANVWWNNRMLQSQQQFQQRLALQQRALDAKNGLTPGGLDNLVVQHAIFGDGVLGRRPAQERDAVTNREAAMGISPVDMMAARLELKAGMANAGAQGRREGNVDYLSQSVPALGQNLIGALNNVNRTDLTGLNTLIRLGKTEGISDPNEQVYKAALQSFVSEYARVINGGTGQSTDSAKEEAWAVLGKDSSPAAIKAAIKFLSTKEISALQNATPLALDALRNPQNYKASTKIQSRLGIPLMQAGDTAGAAGIGVDPEATPQAPPIQPGNGQAAPPAASAAPADKFVKGKRYTSNNVTKTYKGNGVWE